MMPFGAMLEAIAAKTPTPGGGAVACATGALAAATAGMVVSYSVGKKDLAPHRAELEAAAAYLGRARLLFLRLAAEDAEAYGLMNAIQKLPDADPRKAAEMPGAVRASVAAPMACVAACADVLRLCEKLRPISNRYLLSDLQVAAILAESAAQCGACNVRINLPMLAEGERVRSAAALAEMLAHCDAGWARQ